MKPKKTKKRKTQKTKKPSGLTKRQEALAKVMGSFKERHKKG